MRFSPRRRVRLIVVALAVMVIGAACGDPTGTADTGPSSTVSPSLDGLECQSDVRVTGHGDPAPEFAGHATPEDAVRAIASTFAVSGTPELLDGDVWIVVSDAGLTIARADVRPWQSGWIAGDLLACEVDSHTVDD